MLLFSSLYLFIKRWWIRNKQKQNTIAGMGIERKTKKKQNSNNNSFSAVEKEDEERKIRTKKERWRKKRAKFIVGVANIYQPVCCLYSTAYFWYEQCIPHIFSLYNLICVSAFTPFSRLAWNDFYECRW